MLAVADALASAYDGLTSGTAVTGGTAIRGSTARTPNAIPATPYVIVELPEGEVTVEQMGERRVTWDFDVYFLHAKASGDLPRDKAAMLVWLGVLLDALHADMDLSVDAVLKSRLVSVAPEVVEYAGGQFHAWHIVDRVWTEDVVTLTP
jgi:hypothetical protein